VIELQQQISIPFDGQSVGNDLKDARVGFEGSAGFVGREIRSMKNGCVTSGGRIAG
jgi:hypothetical protein